VAFTTPEKQGGATVVPVLRRLSDGASESLSPVRPAAWLRDWSPDGRHILFDTPSGDGAQLDVWVLPLEGDRRPYAFRNSPASELEPAFSPDGRSVAFTSNETGRLEVYVAPFPGPGDARPVTVSGGRYPRWRGDGRELYYVSPRDELTAVAVRAAAGGGPEFGEPRRLFRIRPKELTRCPYDVTPDGQRFIVNQIVDENPPIVLVQSWAAEIPD
jgi:dipeptidyl aminopeptidase/acylaminoacyl peptidase